MRIAVVSDIHGNRTALEAVLADLRETAPDLVFHGGDLAHGGSSPAETVDRIRDLGWPGVVGNTDEMLYNPQSLTDFAGQSPHLQALWTAIDEMAAFERSTLGDDRLNWLRQLPPIQIDGPMALVHASPQSLWRSPGPEASDAELATAYAPLGRPIAVYGHIHRSFVRTVPATGIESTSLPELVVVNTGSVSLSYDGDRRAAYLLLDDAKPTIRRVAYDLSAELKALASCGLPHASWIARTLESASPKMP